MRRRGFALIELVMVTVIMGIIAAIAVPRLTATTSRARDTTMKGSIAQLQRAVDLYTAEHADLNPVTEPDGSTGTLGANVILRLTRFTDDSGAVKAAGPFGPYLRSWPVNLYNQRQSLRIDGAPAGANTDGWRIDSVTLVIEPDQPDTASGIGHISGGSGAALAIGP